jgi:hypothetical protein
VRAREVGGGGGGGEGAACEEERKACAGGEPHGSVASPAPRVPAGAGKRRARKERSGMRGAVPRLSKWAVEAVMKMG